MRTVLTLLAKIADALACCTEVEETVPACASVKEHLRNALQETLEITANSLGIETLHSGAKETHEMEKPVSEEETVQCVRCEEETPVEDAFMDEDGNWLCRFCYEKLQDLFPPEEIEEEEEIRKR